MKKLILILTIGVLIILSSCSSDDNNQININNYPDLILGDWEEAEEIWILEDNTEEKIWEKNIQQCIEEDCWTETCTECYYTDILTFTKQGRITYTEYNEKTGSKSTYNTDRGYTLINDKLYIHKYDDDSKIYEVIQIVSFSENKIVFLINEKWEEENVEYIGYKSILERYTKPF